MKKVVENVISLNEELDAAPAHDTASTYFENPLFDFAHLQLPTVERDDFEFVFKEVPEDPQPEATKKAAEQLHATQFLKASAYPLASQSKVSKYIRNLDAWKAKLAEKGYTITDEVQEQGVVVFFLSKENKTYVLCRGTNFNPEDADASPLLNLEGTDARYHNQPAAETMARLEGKFKEIISKYTDADNEVTFVAHSLGVSVASYLIKWFAEQ